MAWIKLSIGKYVHSLHTPDTRYCLIIQHHRPYPRCQRKSPQDTNVGSRTFSLSTEPARYRLSYSQRPSELCQPQTRTHIGGLRAHTHCQSNSLSSAKNENRDETWMAVVDGGAIENCTPASESPSAAPSSSTNVRRAGRGERASCVSAVTRAMYVHGGCDRDESSLTTRSALSSLDKERSRSETGRGA